MTSISFFSRKRFILFLACIAALGMLFVSEGSYWQSVGSLKELTQTTSIRMDIQTLRRSHVDAETGQRGYLLTGRKEYLQPYEKARKDIAESFKALDNYYRQEPAGKDVLRQLHALSETRLSELATTISLYDRGKNEAAMTILLTDIGREQMEDFRTLSNKLLQFEVENLAKNLNSVFQSLLISRIGVAALTAAGLLAFLMYLRQTSALVSQQLEARRQVQTERDRLEAEVKLRTAQLTDLTHHLQTAREDERNRLARNLHDDLGALLTSAKLDAARIKSRLMVAAPEALDLLAHLVGTLNNSIALGRRIIEDLRPSALSNLGLVPTLEILAREFMDQSGIEVHCTLVPVNLQPSAELMVYRLVQESFTNIIKYAGATQVWVNLAIVDGRVTASVRDDGVGFDTTVQRNSAYGLMGMRFRVEAEGGLLVMVSAPGKGTLIQVTLPLGPSPSPSQPADL